MKKFTRKPPKTAVTLKQMLAESAIMFADKTLYEYKLGKETKTYSYKDFANHINCLGTALADRGYAGKKVAVVGDTYPYWSMTYLAVVNSNGIIVPLDRELSVDSIADFVNASGCEAIAYTKALNGKFTSIADKLPNVSLFIRLSENDDEGDAVIGSNAIAINVTKLIEEGQKLLDNNNSSFTSIQPDMEKCCAVIYTSGTTGTSKGVMLSQNNLITAINAACLGVPYDDTTTIVSVLPINHTYEMTCTHLSAMNIGCSVYLNPSLKYAARSMAYFKPNALVVVPLFIETVYKKIWANIREKGIEKKVRFAMKLSNAALAMGIDLRRKLFKDILAAFGGNIKSIICGGAPVQDQILKDFQTFGITVFEGYGITECSPLVAVNPNGAPKFGSVGKAVNGTTVKIGDKSDDGKGEILVKGGNVMLGYYENPEATAEVFDNDGWFKTGDIGYIDNDGYIFITGRKKNVIILSNGKNVYPEEIEEHFSKSQYVKEIVVIGRIDEKTNETAITAIAYPDFDSYPEIAAEVLKSMTIESLKQINETLPAFKQAQIIELRDTEFEKTTTKKIKRFLVK